MESNLSKTQKSLKDVERLLKLDPTNTELLAQKQKFLGDAINETKTKLEALKEANKKATESVKNYEDWAKAFEPIKSEMEETKKKVSDLKSQMKEMEDVGEINTDEYKNLQQELQTSNKYLRELKSQAKAVGDEFGNPISTDQYDALQREIAETEEKLKSLKKTTGSANSTMASISAATGSFGTKAKKLGNALLPATVAITGVGTASVSMANNFEDAMSQAAGALNKPMSGMESLRQLAIKTGQDTVFSATDAANAITELAKGGLTEADIQAGALQTTMDLAASSGMDLGNAANVVVQAMGAFGLSANESAEAANALAGAAAASSTDVEPLTQGLAQCSAQAKNAGWDIQETTAVLGRFADAGIVGSDAGTSLKTMLQRLAAPTDDAAGVIEKLGINTRDSNDNLLEASEMAEELKNKLGGLSPAARDAALQTIFGSDATRAATIMMSSGAEGLQKYIAATNDQEAAQRLANAQMGDTSKAIEEMKGSLETAAITIGGKIAPVIEKVAKFITELTNKFSALPSGMQTAIVAFLAIIAALGPLLILIGQISLGISALTRVLSLPFTVALGPIVGVIVGVIAAIVAIIAIIKNWGAITEWFGNLWQSVKGKCSEAWLDICEFFTETIPKAWDSLVAKFQTIPEWWSGIWSQVRSFFENVWNTIMQNPIVQTIVTTIQSLFQNLVSTLQGIWSGLTQIASGAWELLKNTILGPVLLLIDLVTGNFSQMSSDAQNIWNNIKNATSQIWSGIKQSVSSLVLGLVNNVKILLSGFRDTASQIWNSVKQTASNIWNNIKTSVVNIAQNLKQSAVQTFHDLVSGIRNALSGLGSTVSNGFQSAIDFITSLPSKAVEWGADFINGIARGIRNAIKNVTDAVSSVADKIRSFLHFSRPDEGPLREYETWMPDMMKGLSGGIYDNLWRVKDAVSAVSKTMSAEVNTSPRFAIANAPAVNVNNAVTVQVGNEQFKGYIVRTATNGISKSQESYTKSKGGHQGLI